MLFSVLEESQLREIPPAKLTTDCGPAESEPAAASKKKRKEEEVIPGTKTKQVRGSVPALDVFQKVLEDRPGGFARGRTAGALLRHWARMQHFGLLTGFFDHNQYVISYL